ncbi:MAG: hypothetical protein DRO09_03520 [Thermoprotei archaeon]|nr:MAG: hypothetical protein DRO09_03520 [Thermoprotei archaeon]
MCAEKLEEYVVKNLDDLLKECEGYCGLNDTVGLLRVDDGVVYEGCSYCIIRAAIDRMNLPSITVANPNGGLMEFVLVGDIVVELAESAAQVYSVSYLEERLNDLVLFNMVSDDEANIVMEWFKGRLSPNSP